MKNKIIYLGIIFILISTLFILTGCNNDKNVDNEILNEVTNNEKNIENNTSSNVNNKIVEELETRETNTNTSNTNLTTTETDNQSTENNNLDELKIGNHTIKYGTYNGIDAATGDILIINSNQTATLNGENYTYTVGKYDIAQDPSSSPNYVDAIIFEATSGKKSFTLSVGNDNNLYDELKCYVYNGN